MPQQLKELYPLLNILLTMKSILCLAVSVLLLSACHSSKNITRTPTTTTPASSSTTAISRSQSTAAVAEVKKVTAHNLTNHGLTANTKVRLTGIGGKDLSVNGKLQMLRDKVLRLSLRFLGVEVGLMEFTPSGVLVIDRINKQYVRANYNEVSFLRQAELDFYSLQSLFWNELFLPGEHQLRAADYSRFVMSHEGNLVQLQPIGTPRLDYVFNIDPTSSTLHRLQVKSNKANEKGQFAFNYDAFEQFSGRPFPTHLLLAVTGTGKKDISLSLNLTSLKSSTDIEANTTVSPKYTQRSVTEVLGKLGM